MTASVHPENERPRWVELQRCPLPVGVTEEYLAVGADQAIAVAYAGASGKGVGIEVGDRRPPTLELRHESARRNPEDVARQQQRQVQEVSGGSDTNASANERRCKASDRFRLGRSWTLIRHASSNRGHDPAGVCPIITPACSWPQLL